ncbi:glycine betaine ABC transporter substrate-binding protein, partial [Amphritea sp.]|uniref:glycine betaine ABC transporter substrate-binding protein n=1 Tax=Amphritea sp. TaxID=1872502 RepID=UPI00356B3642
DFGSGVDKQQFIDCISANECIDPKPTMYPPSLVQTVTTESFAAKSPAAYSYVANRSLTNDQLNNLLAWMEDNQADGEVAAEYFLLEHEDLWSPWVSAAVAAKVKQALQ